MIGLIDKVPNKTLAVAIDVSGSILSTTASRFKDVVDRIAHFAAIRVLTCGDRVISNSMVGPTDDWDEGPFSDTENDSTGVMGRGGH